VRALEVFVGARLQPCPNRRNVGAASAAEGMNLALLLTRTFSKLYTQPMNK
jgi:hypothetical protein